MLEEFNRTTKAWITGEPDSDVWRSTVRNHEALHKIRSKTLANLLLTDPQSTACVRPSYDKELTAWRAQLRPFLVNAGHSCLAQDI